MGLDMYMWKRKYGDIYDWKKDYENGKSKKIKITIENEFPDGEIKKQEYVVDKPEIDAEILLPVAYWRKANEIHRWILKNTVGLDEDKCQKIYISGKKLKTLVETCKEILADHSKAETLLPTQEGFFFGGTEYDEWYFGDLENTIRQLKDVDESAEYIYQASW